MKPTPTWRKVLGGVLTASNRLAPVGQQIAGNDEGRRYHAMQIANQMADDERMQRWNEAQEALRRDQMATNAEARKTSQVVRGDTQEAARQRALTDAVNRGFVSTQPGVQIPAGAVAAKIGENAGYYRSPEEMTRAKKEAEQETWPVISQPMAAAMNRPELAGKKVPPHDFDAFVKLAAGPKPETTPVSAR